MYYACSPKQAELTCGTPVPVQNIVLQIEHSKRQAESRGAQRCGQALTIQGDLLSPVRSLKNEVIQSVYRKTKVALAKLTIAILPSGRAGTVKTQALLG
jgi:hypothetical protein